MLHSSAKEARHAFFKLKYDTPSLGKRPTCNLQKTVRHTGPRKAGVICIISNLFLELHTMFGEKVMDNTMWQVLLKKGAQLGKKRFNAFCKQVRDVCVSI